MSYLNWKIVLFIYVNLKNLTNLKAGEVGFALVVDKEKFFSLSRCFLFKRLQNAASSVLLETKVYLIGEEEILGSLNSIYCACYHRKY